MSLFEFNNLYVFSDRLRTSVNVLGDGYGAGIVYYLSKKEFDEMDERMRLESLELGMTGQKISQIHENDERNIAQTSETKMWWK